MLNREVGRLTASIEAGLKTGLEPVVFLHYPPVYHGQVCTEILEVLKKIRDSKVLLRAHSRQRRQIRRDRGVSGHSAALIACDYTGFRPVLIR